MENQRSYYLSFHLYRASIERVVADFQGILLKKGFWVGMCAGAQLGPVLTDHRITG